MVLSSPVLLGFVGRQRSLVFGFGVAGLLRLVMGLVEIGVGHGEVMRGGDGGGFR